LSGNEIFSRGCGKLEIICGKPAYYAGFLWKTPVLVWEKRKTRSKGQVIQCFWHLGFTQAMMADPF